MQVDKGIGVVIEESDTDDLDTDSVLIPMPGPDDDEEDFFSGVDEVAPPIEEPDDLPQLEEVKPKPVIKVIEVDNPEWVSYNLDLKELVRKFVDDHLGIPSITYETFHAFINHEVERIWHAQQAKVPPKLIHIRFLVGFVNDRLAGFLQCGMLPQRLPHISTLSINYIYSEDIHLTAAFMEKVGRYKKLWRAKHVSCIAINERVRHALERTLTGYRLCGYYVYGFSPKYRAIENFVEAL